MADYEKLVNKLVNLPNETPWLEFKYNNYDPKMIGEDISALANSATLYERNCSYMLWGIDDATHEILGTEHSLQTLKKGNEELENWLHLHLSKNAEFEFHSVTVKNKTVGILIVYSAAGQTVMFDKVDYIRVGSYTKPLNNYPSLLSPLWDRIRNSNFEERPAKQDLELHDALRLIDYSAYFRALGTVEPLVPDGIAHFLLEEGILAEQDDGLYTITNLGAILLAKKLSAYSKISRKAIRVVEYSNNNRMKILKEQTFEQGYVSAFERLIEYIEALIPSEEIISGAVRNKIVAYPILSIREAVANALIHQDFSISGTGPVIEIFSNRIEITNPGTPLIDINRIIDNPPRSRNEKLASLMRRLKMCEELGTGWDKIVIACELQKLPAPKIYSYDESTRVTLFSEAAFSSIALEDKLWACYLHSCIKQIDGEYLTNASLRERFGLKDTSAGSVSRLIKEAVKQGLIKPLDPTTAPRYMKYLPFWA